MDGVKGKIIAISISVMVLAMIAAAALGLTAMKAAEKREANQMLFLMCETGQKNLDSYFKSVEQSVAMVSAYVESDLDGLEEDKLAAHLARVRSIFNMMVYRTNGFLTYYYRIDPSVSKNVKGFWYVYNGEGIVEHEVTDISSYDVRDTSKLVWFTVPRASGRPVWLPPYVTENLGARVVSYNVPVFYQGTFVGVIGIELDYFQMANIVNNITVYENGYAFINDENGKIIYHPRMDVTTMAEQPEVPRGLLSNYNLINYTYEGVEKRAVWLPLSNGMRLNITVPVEELDADWRSWGIKICIVYAVLILFFAVIIKILVGRAIPD